MGRFTIIDSGGCMPAYDPVYDALMSRVELASYLVKFRNLCHKRFEAEWSAFLATRPIKGPLSLFAHFLNQRAIGQDVCDTMVEDVQVIDYLIPRYPKHEVIIRTARILDIAIDDARERVLWHVRWRNK